MKDKNLFSFSTLRDAIRRDLYLFQRNGNWIAFGRISGVILSLNETEANILQDFIKGDDIRHICRKHSVTIEKCLSVLKATIVRIGNRKVVKEKLHPVKSFLIIVTEACNMACTYCYGRFGRKSKASYWMSPATARRVVEVAEKIGVNQIAFFGGEPLMNFTVIKEVVRYAEELGVRIQYGMTTNGTLITEEIARFCQKHNIRVSVSIDGPEAIHNLSRRYPDDSDTFADVKRGIERLKKYDSLDVIEVTHSMKHPSNLKDIINELSSYCERITVSCVEGPAKSLYKDEIVKGNRLNKYYDDMLDILLQEPDSSMSYVAGVAELVDAIISPFIIHRPYICSGVMRRVTIAPDGKLYPCPETMQDGFCFGSVWDDRLFYHLEEQREKILQNLLKERLLNDFWFSNIVDTCIVRISKDESGRSILDDASTFSDCLEKLIARIVQTCPSEFQITASV